MSNPLREQAREVAEARAKAKRLNGDLAARLSAFRDEHAELIAAADKAKGDVAAQEQALRTLIKAAYDATGNKQPGRGLGIRVESKVAFDEAKALKWAVEHRLCLSLDSGAFKKLMLATPSERPDFVTVKDMATTTIATDLDAALREWEAE